MSYLKYRIGTGLALFATASFLGGCLNQVQSGVLSSCSSVGACTAGIDPTNPAGFLNPTVPESPFKLTLKSYWQGDTGKTNPKVWDSDLKLVKPGTEITLTSENCIIPAGTQPAPYNPDGVQFIPPSGATEQFAVNDHPGVRVCAVKIPETQLYYSSLEFTVETPANHQCDVVYFDPYYYLFSRSKAASPPWTTAPIDCETLTGGLPGKDCYSGPAKDFFNLFPFIVTESNPIVNKAVSFKKTWSIKPAQEALNGAMTRGNRWTAFQPQRDKPYNIHNFDRTIVGNPHDWRFMCVKQGSNLNYRYIVRIIPVKDSPYYQFPYEKIGWSKDYEAVNDNYDPAQAPEFTFDPTEGPIDGGTVLSFTFDDGKNPPYKKPIDPSSAVIIGEPYSGSGTYVSGATTSLCTPNCPDPKMACYTCVAPAISVEEVGSKNVYFSNVVSKLRKGSNQFEYKLLKVDNGSYSGPAAGGTKIKITGEGIAKDAKITIDDVPCTVADSSKDWANDGTSIICKTGAHPFDGISYPVIVSNPTSKQDNLKAPVKPLFTYQ